MIRKIILSCSKKKKTVSGLIPAIERYDGIMFRLLRRYQQKSLENLDIYIISAEFGFISYLEKIPFYEQEMCNLRAEQLKKKILKQAEETFLKNFAPKKDFLFINLGNIYLRAFNHVFNEIDPKLNITFASGSSGKRLSIMYDWLYGPDSPLRIEQKETNKSENITLKGVQIELNKSQIYNLARTQLLKTDSKIFEFQSWYVLIDEVKVSPKWLVSQITNLPVNSFHSDQARKVLHKLGIRVKRV